MKDNQKKRVLAYMKEHGGITSLEAFNELGVTRLSAVIFNLKADGVKVGKKAEKGLNRFGEKTCFDRYFVQE